MMKPVVREEASVASPIACRIASTTRTSARPAGRIRRAEHAAVPALALASTSSSPPAATTSSIHRPGQVRQEKTQLNGGTRA